VLKPASNKERLFDMDNKQLQLIKGNGRIGNVFRVSKLRILAIPLKGI
jgi:hypothetical protein